MKAYKGFNKDMTCRGFQFEEGKEYHEDNAELCKSGFHACENPLDCFKYYSPADSVYHEVELDELSEKEPDDSKICGKNIKIGAKLSVARICELHFDYIKSKTTNSIQGESKANLSAQDGSSLSAQDWSSLSAQDWSSLSVQNRSSLSAQDWSSLSAQNRSSLSAQDCSSLSAGKNSVISAFNSKAKGGMNTLIALANREIQNGEYVITDFKAAIVDGIALKPDTWYKLENGEFAEVEENKD